MARLEKPRGLNITFEPSERQYEVWNALQPNHCDKCGGELEMKPNGYDRNGHQIFMPMCRQCGNTNIPEQILEGGSAGGGKAGLLDSKVCTPFGFRELRDIKVGDIVTDPTTGGVQEVMWLHPIKQYPFYRIHFVDGTYFDCSEGHLWNAHESRKKPKRVKLHGGSLDTVWPTLHIYEWYQRKKKGMYNGKNLIIPLSEPIKFAPGDYKTTIDPYILGALIGDGCMTDFFIKNDSVQLTTMDKEIVDRFEECGYDMSYSKAHSRSRSKDYMIYSSSLVRELKELGIAGNRSETHYIPECYKITSIENRVKLMQGLIDTDGYVDSRGHIIYTTISKQLAEDVVFVVRSLGGIATITKGPSGYKNQNGDYVSCSDHYDVQIRTKMNPDLCGLTRKRERVKYEFNGGASILGKRITDVEYLGMREGRCITVSNPLGLYVVDGFTVTHNSYLGSCWLILSCMQFPGIRMAVARLVRKTLIETTWKTINDVLKEWGLVEDVNYHINGQFYTITFWNGSMIMAMDLSPKLSDPDYNWLGSLEITGGFIDEVSEVPEKAVEVLASRIRYKIESTFIVGKLLMSTNPCLTWVRSTFVMDDDGNPVTLPLGYRYIPFSLFDNPDAKFRAIYYNKLSKLRNKADRDRLLYGNWLFTTSNKMAAYWNFDGEKHLVQNLKETKYDPMKPLILSFDFNVNPYMSCLPIQFDFEAKKIYVFPEIVGYPKDKHNNTPAFTRWIAQILIADGQVGGVLLTGDPAGAARSTQTEDGVNNFTIANKNLTTATMRPKIQLLTKQPAMITRLEFINEIFQGYKGWQVLIDVRCHRLTEDFIYQKKNPDGTKEKKKVLNDNGERVERYGHFSDCFDYALVYYLSKEYQSYRTATNDIVTTVDMGETVYGDFDY